MEQSTDRFPLPPETGNNPPEAAEAPRSGNPPETEATDGPGGEGQGEPLVRAKYNKRYRSFTVQEAAPLVQKGLKFEAFEPQYQALKYLAAAEGSSIPALVERLLRETDEALYRQALEECGGNEEAARKLADYQKREWEAKAPPPDESRQIAERQAAELRELSEAAEKPFGRVEDVPAPVRRMAESKGISLLDAYLRLEHTRMRRQAETLARQEAAARASAGSMAGEPMRPDPDIEAFSAAFAQAIR